MAKLLVEEVIVRFGTPYVIHTDQGVQFESILFQEVCRLLQIQKTRTTPYHPQSEGWSSGIIEQYLRCCPHLSMNIKTIGMNTSLTFQWLKEPQSMKQRESLRINDVGKRGYSPAGYSILHATQHCTYPSKSLGMDTQGQNGRNS